MTEECVIIEGKSGDSFKKGANSRYQQQINRSGLKGSLDLIRYK